jgi:hypothetical protein
MFTLRGLSPVFTRHARNLRLTGAHTGAARRLFDQRYGILLLRGFVLGVLDGLSGLAGRGPDSLGQLGLAGGLEQVA